MRPASQLFELAGERPEGGANLAGPLAHVGYTLANVRNGFELARDRRVPPLELRRE